MSNNPSEELKKLEQQLLAVEEEGEEIRPETETDEGDGILFPEEDQDFSEEEISEEEQLPEAEAQEPFVERDEEFEAFYQDILKEFGPDTKPRKKTSSAKKAVHHNTYSDHAPSAKKEKGIKGLVITLCLECAGIVGIVLWWVLRIL